MRELVENGDVVIREVNSAGKPVMVDAMTNKFVKGTGRSDNSPDNAVLAREHGFGRHRAGIDL